ncbi:hypothetical protein KIN20_006295 [Parelaphostrongylus tenuis]|uniref:kynurenine--oxoglutarate transaminase n=1 Tax=Parelaphostrongylus tenuis TaxID=148309 RepID=A0AAD5MK55_PARTN|nr:hypothetical protein KIN20_006295 [Parelaphostrongylus tenuis]
MQGLNQLKVTSPTSSVTSLILFESKASGLCPILVTVAYLALSYLFMVLVNLGDENLITDPAYDSYASQVVVADDVPIHCVLSVSDQDRTTSDFRFGIGQLRAKCSNSAKAIVSNNPKSNGLIVVADEAYEWLVWNKQMIRFASHSGLNERTVSIGSPGKAFSVNGWRFGWCIAQKHLMTPMRIMHQNCFHVQ